MRPQEIALPTHVDSDLAVRAYIESLLFESDMPPAAVADDASVDSASDAASVSVSDSDSDMPSNSHCVFTRALTTLIPSTLLIN